jgi:hypothetical protein
MNRRELLKRGLTAAPLAVVAALGFCEQAEASKKKPKHGMECICTDINVGGDGKDDKTPNGSIIIVKMVRRDNGRRVVAFIDRKTKIYRQGSRIKFLDLRDMLYSTPQGVREGYVDVPTSVWFTATQLAKRIDFDP